MHFLNLTNNFTTIRKKILEFFVITNSTIQLSNFVKYFAIILKKCYSMQNTFSQILFYFYFTMYLTFNLAKC